LPESLMSPKNDPASVIADAQWLPSHWDRAANTLQFAWLARADHSDLTFLADEYLQQAQPPVVTLPLPEVQAASAAIVAPALNYVFHSAFCCSTLLARALDVPGVAIGLKEPQILNELADALRAQALPRDVLATAIRLLARPFGTGEKVVVKPSNVANALGSALLDLEQGSRAIFLYAPLPRFLRSIADKGLWGRRWARRLYALLVTELKIDFGLSTAEQFELTDLQISALAWLMQHAQGAALIARFSDRVRTLDSETFLARRADAIDAVATHFGLALDERQAREIARGPVFATHSKEIGRSFDPEQPLAPRKPIPIIDEEIEMVTTWTRNVAENAGIAVDLPAASALIRPA
jgi:hypothetical protein